MEIQKLEKYRITSYFEGAILLFVSLLLLARNLLNISTNRNRPEEIQDDLTLSIKVHVDQVNCCRFDHSKEHPTVVSCGSDHLVKVATTPSFVNSNFFAFRRGFFFLFLMGELTIDAHEFTLNSSIPSSVF